MSVEEDAIPDPVGRHGLTDRDGDRPLLVLALAGVFAADGAAQILGVEEVDVLLHGSDLTAPFPLILAAQLQRPP
jgi:hypothetical protein